ncbi:MAG: hypothetical protein IJ329_02605 [Clostridia bacterium]|nr:hypothetical protein [Clostridia bacterium]
MKSWKKRWKDELETMLPALSEEVRSEPILSSQTANQKQEKKSLFSRFQSWLALRKKRFYAGVACCAAAVIALCVALPFALSTSDAGAALIVEINPRAVFSVDGDGKVTAVVATNADADVILSDRARVEEMQGESVERAVQVFVDYAAKLGYLDLSSQTAVRVSACGDETALTKTGETIENYFLDKGVLVAVLTEDLTTDAFCERAGLAEVETFEALTETIHELPCLYSEWETTERFDEIYGQIVSLDGIACVYERFLRDNLAKIEQGALDVLRLIEYNNAIESSEDNPGFLLKDYWHIRENYDNVTFTETFAAQMQTMDNALADYERTYGTRIENVVALLTVANGYSGFPTAEIVALLENFTFEKMFSRLVDITVVLNNVGVDTSVWEALCKIPDTIEEYVQNVQSYALLRLERFKPNYESWGTGEALSQQAYSDYIDTLIEQYGSLEAYWNNLHE